MILALCSYMQENAMSRNGQIVLAIGSTLSKYLIGEYEARNRFQESVVDPLKSQILGNNHEGLFQYLSVCDMKASWEMVQDDMWKTTKWKMLYSHAFMVFKILESKDLTNPQKLTLINPLLATQKIDEFHLKLLQERRSLQEFKTKSPDNPYPLRGSGPAKDRYEQEDPSTWNDISRLTNDYNVSEDLFSLLFQPSSQYWAMKSVCSRCLCSASMVRVSLYDLPTNDAFLLMPDSVAEYNLFGFSGRNHIDDVLHFGERTVEHMLNRTCLWIPDILNQLAREIKTRSKPTIHLQVKTLRGGFDDTPNMDSDLTDNEKSGFSFIDASHVFDTAALAPDILKDVYRSTEMDAGEFVKTLQYMSFTNTDFESTITLISSYQTHFESLSSYQENCHRRCSSAHGEISTAQVAGIEKIECTHIR